jgi:pyruvate dehydrogenase E2 component (dihydrolipoamide acetyltransferase)
MATKDFKLPDLGEGVHEGQIVRVMVAPGDVVREDQPLMEVETDKAAVVIPCPFAGTVEKVHVRDGQLVHVGEVMVTINEGAPSTGEKGRATSVGLSTHATKVRMEKSVPATNPTISTVLAKPQAARHTPASPAVRKLARTMGVNIETIRGSGPGGRVQRADVEMARSGSSTHTKPERLTLTPAPSPSKGVNSAGSPRSVAVAARVAHAPLPESQITEPQAMPMALSVSLRSHRRGRPSPR